MLFGVLLVLLTLFLIMVVLVQRGRGGGLAGALGGAGGQSAFGAKAGDTFTRITIVTATLWFLLCIAAVYFVGSGDSSPLQLNGSAAAPPDGAVQARPDGEAAGDAGLDAGAGAAPVSSTAPADDSPPDDAAAE